MQQQPNKTYLQLAAVSSLGIELALAIGIFSYLGFLADENWETGPWLTLVGFLFGGMIAVLSMMKTVRRLNEINLRGEQARTGETPISLKEKK